MAVNHTVKLLSDLSALVVAAIGLAKSHNYFAALGMAGKLMAIIPEAKAALPELQHLQGDDAEKICEAAYNAIAAIVAAA